ncbi:type II toxin-antitoxin system RelE family toxin [Jiella marina]|uniref:type II toxin-antitoxin system RelE family toxin n=1 Tax=Jiella sp. LLJ827 TaxID=2917712 RepID=UPI00350E4150
MKVQWSHEARKGLRKMPPSDRVAIVEKLGRYAETGLGDVVKLSGAPFYRLRHGDWRAVFERIDGIYVVRVAHRREVYRK